MNELLRNLTQGLELAAAFFLFIGFTIIFLIVNFVWWRSYSIAKFGSNSVIFVVIFSIIFMIADHNFKKELKVSLVNNAYFSVYSYKVAGNGDYYSRDFIVYKIDQTEAKKTVYFNEKLANGLEVEKQKEDTEIIEVKNVLFKTSCKGYSINKCVEKVNELLKDNSYALKLNEDKVVKL